MILTRHNLGTISAASFRRARADDAGRVVRVTLSGSRREESRPLHLRSLPTGHEKVSRKGVPKTMSNPPFR